MAIIPTLLGKTNFTVMYTVFIFKRTWLLWRVTNFLLILWEMYFQLRRRSLYDQLMFCYILNITKLVSNIGYKWKDTKKNPQPLGKKFKKIETKQKQKKRIEKTTAEFINLCVAYMLFSLHFLCVYVHVYNTINMHFSKQFRPNPPLFSRPPLSLYEKLSTCRKVILFVVILTCLHRYDFYCVVRNMQKLCLKDNYLPLLSQE